MTMKLADLKYEYRLGDYKYDPNGTCVSWMFDLCESLYWVHGYDIPDELEFRPGMSDSADEGEREWLDNGDPEVLLEFLMILNRLDNMQKAAGMTC